MAKAKTTKTTNGNTTATSEEDPKKLERMAKRAAKRKEFEDHVDLLRTKHADYWNALQALREALSTIPTAKRRQTVQASARILRNASRPGKAEQLRKKLEALEAKKAELLKELNGGK